MEYPYVKCLNPIVIWNKYINERMIVDCGKCAACRMRKAANFTTRCEMESQSNQYTYFITLTYDNKYLPKAILQYQPLDSYTDEKGCLHPSYEIRTAFCRPTPFNKKGTETIHDEVLGTAIFPSVLDKEQLLKKVNQTDKVPILYKRDLQLFIKRLRKKYERTENLRFFACGEYGPVHFRPHYHLLLWFNYFKTAERLEENIRACWPFGRVSLSLSRGKSSSYVAKYVNGSQHLPSVFKLRTTTPFNCHSFYLGEQLLESSNESIPKDEPARFVKRNLRFNGSNTELSVWRSFTARYFPKCQGFSRQDRQQHRLSYFLNEQIGNWCGETSPIEQARFIRDYVELCGFYHQVDKPNEILQFLRETQKAFKKETKIINGKKEEIAISYYPSIVTKSELDKFERSVYIMCLGSRFFFDKLCERDYNKAYSYIDKIENFYKETNNINLQNQLKVQSLCYKENKMKGVDYLQMYNNTAELEAIQKSRLYRQYKNERDTKFKNSVKHKELNDKNLIFNY